MTKGEERQRCALSVCVNQQVSDIKDRGKNRGCGLEWQKASDFSACVQTRQREFYEGAAISDIGRIFRMKTASQEGCCSCQGCMLSYFSHSSCHRPPPPPFIPNFSPCFPFPPLCLADIQLHYINISCPHSHLSLSITDRRISGPVHHAHNWTNSRTVCVWVCARLF